MRNAASSLCRRSSAAAGYFTTGGGLVAIATAGLGKGFGVAAAASGTPDGGGGAMATGAIPNSAGGTNWFEAICCCIRVSGNSQFHGLFLHIQPRRLTPGYHGADACLSLDVHS
jgi:hypothetical protein